MPETKSSLAKEKALKDSLKEAARILNRIRHTPLAERSMTMAARRTAGLAIVMHQVYCPDEESAIGQPTPDITVATREMRRHNRLEGHNSRIVSSA